MLPGLPRTTSFRLNPILLGFIDISFSCVEISLHTKFELPRLTVSKTASFRLSGEPNSGLLWGDPNFFFIFLLVALK